MRLLIIFILVFITGCTTMQPLESKISYKEIVSNIEVDDNVTILTKSGEKISLVVKQISKDTIAGKDQKVKFKDINKIKVERFNPWKTAGYTAAAFVSMVVISVATFRILIL